MASLQHFINHFMAQPLTGLLLTLLVFQLALMLYQKLNRPAWLHPVATSAIVIAAVLKSTHVDYGSYLSANKILYFLLGPTTVALAIPLYNEFHVLRKQALPVLITVLLGAVAAPGIALLLAWMMGASDPILLALLPKSVTTPIAIGIAQQIGALPTLTTGIVVFTGVLGVLISPLVFYMARLSSPQLQGVVLGINAHGVGTARAFEIAPDSGAFATMSMGLTGTFTALTLPYLVPLLPL